MILLFGGTTEGRTAIKVLEEAGSPYFYSTRSSSQDVELVHGNRLTGPLDSAAITDFCQSHRILLIVDAAHPFAVELHRNLLAAAAQLQLPVVRLERQYAPRSSAITWCSDYADAMCQMERQGIERLLILTGMQTIGRLRQFWQRHDCWCRILDRDDSRQTARDAAFPEERLVYYNSLDGTADDTPSLLASLRPQAILTKESGTSGGFDAKVAAAQQAGVKVFAVERPSYPALSAESGATTVTVDGPYGLRRAIERLLPDFFPLKSGLTTGTCATAAAVAATIRLLDGQTPAEVPVRLPDGETISVAVSYGDGYAACLKHSGDDPDVTDGLEIRAAVDIARHPTRTGGIAVSIVGGEGVGRFTLPGFDYPPGEAAINRVPRQMIERNVMAVAGKASGQCCPTPSATPGSAAHDTVTTIRVTISVPDGEATARRTFNPRLGIEGGISIIGVSGIVKPFSEEAFVSSIRKCMEVAKASGTDRVVVNSGAKSERFVRALYPTLPRQAFVEYGNYIGDTLSMASDLAFSHVTLGVMLGKAVKLAEGQLDTHSRKGTMNKAFIRQMVAEAGCDLDLSDVTLARELWERLPQGRLDAFATVVIDHCRRHCKPLLPAADLTILLITDDGTVYGMPQAPTTTASQP